MRAVFLDYGTMGSGLDLSPLENVVTELTVFDASSDAQIIRERIRDADAVFTNKIELTRTLIEQATKLRFIGLTATGTDNIDLDSASERGIAVANIRGYCTQSVVEHVVGVILTLTHSLDGFRSSVRAGDWQTSDQPFLLNHPIRELSAMTLGIVGYGELGKRVAAAGRTFGMNVIAAGSRSHVGAASVPLGYSSRDSLRVSFEELLKQSDIISLHCPLNDATRSLFGHDQFQQMKTSAILINTARGGLIDSSALAAALENGDIAAAAVDVLPQEPPVDGDPLLAYRGSNLIVTPHIAWATDEARQNAIDELAANTRAFLAGEERNRVV